MDKEAWCVRLDFASLNDERLFLAWWRGSAVAADYDGEPSGDGPRMFLYFPTQAAADAVADVLRRTLVELEVQPVEISVDEWLEDESRWSGDSKRPMSWLGDLIDAVLGGR